YLRNWQVTFLLYTLGVFISEYTAKAFTEPRDYRVVFLIQQNALSYELLPTAKGVIIWIFYNHISRLKIIPLPVNHLTARIIAFI
ncbi:hypothetical protein, partial [Dialister invisus]|uniref:hypothetical protein n=1 Tax=Dialister invisus TaxID=218538 RepID=UPI003AB75954